jgi:uncharacterized protein with HEPN domain
MQPEAAKYLWDALTAAERVQRFVHGKSFDDYAIDELLRSGVERQLEVIGEALGQLRKSSPQVADQVPDLPKIVAFRNVLIHGYATVDDVLVWGTVDGHLEPLIGALKALFAQSGPMSN